MLRTTAALIFLCLSTPASAHQFNCDEVRAYVAKHGIKAAEAWARTYGYSEAAIKEARKCLK